jgi:protein TonB
LSLAADEYIPSTRASRATVLSMIFAAHVVGAIAVISIGGVAVVVKAVPLLVTVLPEVIPPRPAEPVRTLPLPVMKPPEIRIPTPPPIETIVMVRVEEKPEPAPVMPAPVAVKAVAAPVAPPPPAVEPPRGDLAYLNNPSPVYPVFAKRAREQGVVMLRVRVDAAGKVEGIELHKSSGSERLDDAALAAVRRWRFVPARMGDRTVAGVAIVPIHFQLEG